MASVALVKWQTARMPALAAVEAQCLAPGRLPPLADENVRGYVMLLSAHFQGFCRDLYSECVQAVVNATVPSMQFTVQKQCEAHRQLEVKNPTLEAIYADFDRFGIDLSLALRANAANLHRLTHVTLLNKWRNYSAHYNPLPPAGGGAFTVGAVGGWRASVDGLVSEIDRELYNHLVATTGAAPW